MTSELSGIQTQFVINTELYPQSAIYSIPTLTRIDGELDVERLRAAWNRVFGEADVLRSCILRTEQGLRFATGLTCEAPWEHMHCEETTIRAEVQRIAEEPFELSRAPLVRFALLGVSPVHHYVLIVQHHAVTDLASQQVLAENLARAYADPSAELSVVSYESFVRSEREFLSTHASDRAREYWREKMSQQFDVLRLPSATHVPAAFNATGKALRWKLAGPLAASLLEADECGNSAFLSLLTAYACLLFRISTQRRFFIGVPFTNRIGFGGETLIGACVNGLPVLVEVRQGDRFADVFARLRAEMLTNHRHQRLPFVEIASMYAGERDPLRPWLLQAGFTQVPPVAINLEGLKCSALHVSRTGAQMDLYFGWWKDGDVVRGYWEYNDASFGPDEVLLWQSAYERLLEAVVRSPDKPVAEVSLIDVEHERNLSGSSRHVAFPLEKSMADHLRSAYACYADNTAIVYRGEATSYRDFSHGVARVAHRLVARAGAGGRIVVLLERSANMLHALHGIVLSGNAYVPMGLDWPDERVADILSDVEPAFVLTDASNRHRFEACEYPVVTIEELLAETEVAGNEVVENRVTQDGAAADFPDVKPDPEDPIYIMYTSGTTGRPKGVVLPHRGIVNHVYSMQERYRLQEGERSLFKIPYTFDVSVWELFWPLTFGACLVIAEEHQHKDPRALLQLAVEQRINHLDFVPSLMTLFLNQDGLERLTHLSDVYCIGEALVPDLVRLFQEKLPQVRLHNLYGPTEASVAVSYWECSERDIARGAVPIGYPLANAAMYVVDENGCFCPPLVKGEILLGGTCLATGYWKRPELTAERFIPNPFGEGRLYRTGDWGRYALDGSVEYLERQDTQTKIRGVRIELAEIETCMRHIDAIAQAAVVKGTSSSGNECLIAYYTRRTGSEVDSDTIRRTLRGQLPAVVVPDFFVEVDVFPTNDNGKLNRKALPDHYHAVGGVAPAPVGVLEGHEEKVAQLWGQLLGVACTDTTTNFFDMGGNSMTLLELRGHLEREFDTAVTIAELFQYPTISGMASLFRPTDTTGEAADSLTDRVNRRRDSLRDLGARRLKGHLS